MIRFNYLKCFPDFEYQLPEIEGFEDDSWQNDVCPSLYNKDLNLKLYCDYLNPTRRECGGKRFTLQKHDDDMCINETLLNTDKLSEIHEAIERESKGKS